MPGWKNAGKNACATAGLASDAGVGPPRCGALPAGLARGARIFLAQYGLEPRLSLPMQLVRKAHLGRQLPLPRGTSCGCRDARAEAALPARSSLVRGRYFRALITVDARIFGCGRGRGRADSVQDAVPLRPDDARYGGRSPPCG